MLNRYKFEAASELKSGALIEPETKEKFSTNLAKQSHIFIYESLKYENVYKIQKWPFDL